MKFHFKSHLSLLLVGLMLVNTSMAVEILVHDAHGHEVASTHHEVAVSDHTSHSGTGSAHPVALDQPSAPDCHCDDVCCVGSSGFATTTGASLSAGNDTDPVRSADLYQSILLDMVLPPPTE